MDVLPTPEQELGWRMAGLETRMEAISERLGRLEVSLRDGITLEVSEATTELRRAISELGRRLVQDLPTELARHRDAIVAELLAELRPPPAPVELPDPAPPTIVDGELSQTAPAVPDHIGAADSPEAAERRRASRRRRRQG